MFKKICIISVFGYVCLHVLFLGLAAIYVKQLFSSRDLTYISHKLTQISNVINIEKEISFGAWKLPYAHEAFSVVESGTGLVSNIISTTKVANNSFSKSVQGTPISENEIDIAFESIISLSKQFSTVRQNVSNERIVKIVRFLGMHEKLIRLVSQLTSLESDLSKLYTMKSELIELLGYSSKKHIVILTQNNMELWPTGGYLGSYVEFFFNKGAIEQLTFQDIGVPNGQVVGYVKAPKPISTFTHNGQTPGWKLRESNWNPDFPKTAPVIEWFFTEGKIAPIDYMVAINLIPIVDLLQMTGPVYLADYNVTLTSENFYFETQKQTSLNFFDGSTQKRDYLTSLGKRLLTFVIDNPSTMMPKLFQVIRDNLEAKQILISAKDKRLADFLMQQRWDGQLLPVECKNGDNSCVPDFLHINEANVGINKTNCCIDRKLSDEIDILSNTIRHHLTISYVNHNPPKPNPPGNWGGGYKVYQRLYVPKGSKLVSYLVNNQTTDMSLIDNEVYEDKQVFGFLGLIEGADTGTYTIDYDVPMNGSLPYQLYLVKQSGITEVPWSIEITQNETHRKHDFLLKTDTWIE